MENLWFISALIAAVLWGLSYALSEPVLKNYSIPFYLIFSAATSLCVYVTIMITSNFSFKADLANLKAGKLAVPFALSIITLIVANLLISYAIQSKNATLAAFIEISYPVFTALFAFILFKQTQVNMYSLLGGLMIMGGSFLILKFSE